MILYILSILQRFLFSLLTRGHFFQISIRFESKRHVQIYQS